MNTEQKAIYSALAAVLLWSTVATAFKIALRYNDVVPLLFGASLTSLLCFCAVLQVRGQLMGAFRLFPGHLKNAFLLGALNPLVYYLVLFEAYRRLPAQVAQPVNFTWAIVLAFLSVPILKHRLTRFDLMGLVLGYVGVVIISLAGKNVSGTLDGLGLFLAIISTLLWALFWLLNTRSKLKPNVQLLHNFLVSTPILFFLMLALKQPVQLSMPSILSLVYVGLFEMGITFVLWQQALKLTSRTARIGTLIFLSPFVSLFLISLILKEPLQWQTFLGLAFIICGVLLSRQKS